MKNKFALLAALIAALFVVTPAFATVENPMPVGSGLCMEMEIEIRYTVEEYRPYKPFYKKYVSSRIVTVYLKPGQKLEDSVMIACTGPGVVVENSKTEYISRSSGAFYLCEE